MADLVTYELDGPVAVIGLNRAAKRNAISDALIDALDAAVSRAHREARAAVLFGHGDHFSSGLDLAEHAGRTSEQGVQTSYRWHAAFGRISRGPIPFVGALHGAAVGGGLELAASLHIRVADADAYFALPEGRRGIFVGGGGSVRIARIIGVSRMTDMMLTGRAMTARQAESVALVHYLTPPGEALAKAREVAGQVAGNAGFSNFAVINALPRMQDLSSEDGLFFEAYVAAAASATAEAKAGLAAFLEKRAERVAPPRPDDGEAPG